MPRPSKTLLLLAALLALPGTARAFDLVQPSPDQPFRIRLYGYLDGEVQWARALGGATPFEARMRVADANSRIGLYAAYRLGPDTDAEVQLEGYLNNFEQGGVNDLGQSATLETRNTYVGVRDSRFGALRIGFYDNAYRSLAGTGDDFVGNFGMTKLGLDLWDNTSAQVSGGFSSLWGRGEARLANSIHYRTPEWYGFRFGASYGFDETEALGGRRDHYSLGATYGWNGFKIGVAWDHQSNTGVDSDALLRGQGMKLTAVNDVSTNFFKGMVSYLAPTGTYIGIGYERSVYGVSGFIPPVAGQMYTPVSYGDMSQGGFLGSVAQVIGDLTVMASYGKLGGLSNAFVGSGADYNSSQVSVGAKYAFSPAVMAYAFVTRIDNGPQQNINLGAPIYTNNIGTSSAYLAPGNKPTAGGTGLIVRF
jgi:predicted porin